MVQLNIRPLPAAVIIGVVFLFTMYKYGIYDLRSHTGARLTSEGTEGEDGEGALRDNVLDFFDNPQRDGIAITWSHGTNRKAELADALPDKSIIMLEADVRVRLSDGVPVMAHTVADVAESDLTLEKWLTNVSGAKKGIKLDIKSTSTLEPSLLLLKRMKDILEVPVWINSDVLPGPNANSTDVDAKTFFEKTSEIFPHCTLSPGWKTGYKQDGENEYYTQAMVDEMHKYCKTLDLDQLINFPVRASLTTAKSIESLKSLLDKSSRYSLTVWHSTEEKVDVADLVAIRKSFKPSQVFYDLPKNMMRDFHNAL